MLHTLAESRPQPSGRPTPPPIIELISLAPGSVKTHLLYRLCSEAVLPKRLGGKQACAIIIDTDGNFFVQRLAAQIQHLLRERDPKSFDGESNHGNLREETIRALDHVHIFQPLSLASTVATLDSLQTYLFDESQHHSIDRQVAFIAIDSASAFYWEDKLETEDAAFFAATSSTGSKQATQPSGYVQLSTSLKAATKALICPGITLTWYLGPPPSSHHDLQEARSFRPQIPALQAGLRLVVHRLPLPKFAASISFEQALRDAEIRQKSVKEGRFECFVNEWGLDERTRQRVGGGFVFRITGSGVVVGEE